MFTTRLSEDLYEKPTHFLQELIQNADDNEYNAEATPTMLVNYTNRVLQVSCNERGFSKSNVEALCKIGQSTKSGSAKNLGYTGEKGLGFKSIFKVSNVVWIRSGQYSFKFDKNCTLGMLAPAWAEFPGQHIPGFTSIRIQILPEISDDPLLGELQSLDPRLLVFLRRLQKIVVTIDTPLVQWSTTIRKDVVSSEDGEVDQVTLRSDSEEQQYAVLRHTVENLPFEHRRQGTFRSVVTLGFPVIDGTCVELPSQHVYAFLPIRDFGFKVRSTLHHLQVFCLLLFASRFKHLTAGGSFFSTPTSYLVLAGKRSSKLYPGIELYATLSQRPCLAQCRS